MLDLKATDQKEGTVVAKILSEVDRCVKDKEVSGGS